MTQDLTYSKEMGWVGNHVVWKELTMNRKFSFFPLLFVLASPAIAQSDVEVEPGNAPAEINADAEPATKHCIAELTPATYGAKTSLVGKPSCYDTFAAAMAAATDNTVVLAADTAPESVREADVVAAVTRIIGIDYDGAYYKGASLIWYARNSYGCLGAHWYTANVPFSFNNKLTSTRGFSGCYRNTSYDGYWQTGSWVRCFPNCYYIGSFLNNRTSSKKWSY